MGHSAYPESQISADCGVPGGGATGVRHGRRTWPRLAPRGVLDERERRRSHGRERDESGAPPALSTARAGLRLPRPEQLVGWPEALERDSGSLSCIAPAGEVVRDRIVDVVAELGGEPTRSQAASLRGDGREILLGLAHWLSTAWMLAANRSHSWRRPSSALRPRAVRS
jgi:hypothetical protein